MPRDVSLERQVAELERALRTGQEEPEALLTLARLYWRAGRAPAARDALQRARDVLSPLAEGADGGVELRTEWTELHEELERVEAEIARQERSDRRAELLAVLAKQGLDRASHDELIRIEIRDELELHPEPPRCPACQGPLDRVGDRVRCARTGRDGDYCRHTDADDLHDCARCGLVLRAWNPSKGKLRPHPHEPPGAALKKSRCKHCEGQVVDWRKHFLRCPQAKPRDFPVCAHCRRRGFHQRSIVCPRCELEVAHLDCLE